MEKTSSILPLSQLWDDQRFRAAGEEVAQQFFSQLGLEKAQELLLYNLVQEAERVYEILCFIGGVIPSAELASVENKALSDNGVFLQRIDIQLRSAQEAIRLAKERFPNYSAVGDNLIKNINDSRSMVAEMLQSIFAEMEKRPPSDEIYE